MIALVDRLRSLSPAARHALFAKLARTPGRLADIRYQFEEFWAREDQIVSVAELERHPIIVFGGIRGTGKTRAAIQLFNREIYAGRAQRPRIIAATDADVAKTVIFGPSGIMACLPPELRPTWRPTEGHAGVLRYRNGVDVGGFSAHATEQLTGGASDLDLMDDPAKWGPGAETVYRHCRTSCRIGNRTGIMATTRRGTYMLRRLLSGEVEGVLIRRPADIHANEFNLSAGYFSQIKAELGDSDFYRQELEDEDVIAAPFADIDFNLYRVSSAPPFERFISIAVWIDPSVSSSTKRCECGIVVVGMVAGGMIYVLEDLSGVHGVDEWPDIAIEAVERWQPRTNEIHLGVETNRGDMQSVMLLKQAEMMRRMRLGQPGVSMYDVRHVRTDKSKAERAHPLPRHYKAGRIMHVGQLDALEKQLRELDETVKPGRDRADAAVYGLLDMTGQLDHTRPGVPVLLGGGATFEPFMGPAPLGSISVGAGPEAPRRPFQFGGGGSVTVGRGR